VTALARVLRFLQLVTAAKQALLHHSFSNARQLLTEAIAIHPSFKVSKDDTKTFVDEMPRRHRQTKQASTSTSTSTTTSSACSSTEQSNKPLMIS
jgi:hypothetical protein